MQSFSVYYFDGISSVPKNVTLELHDSFVRIQEFDLSYDFKDIEVGVKLKDTPQSINFSDGSYCQLKPYDFFSLPGSSKDKLILKIESKLKYALLFFALLCVFTVFCLTYGSTILANTLAPQIPTSAAEKISRQTFELLDKHYMSESKLDKKTQDFIKREFDRLLNKNSDFKLHFRSSEIFSANAFALPNGDIILLDDLVKLEKNEEFKGIMGILAHESGHVVHMHGLKTLVKTSISSALIGYLIGDFSGFTTAFTTAAIDAKYSRDYENEADLYATEIMKKNNISAKYTADLFDEIIKKSKEQPNGIILEYSILSSHPAMEERIKKFRENK
ncbi:MAG: M48 family metallopeptidase [Campylobacteraceae bacterium]|jgi:Zn-dependent protease with chaperone function|nr:M48 family metallopeptidase [Campylobacteraceae bacterium]